MKNKFKRSEGLTYNYFVNDQRLIVNSSAILYRIRTQTVRFRYKPTAIQTKPPGK